MPSTTKAITSRTTSPTWNEDRIVDWQGKPVSDAAEIDAAYSEGRRLRSQPQAHTEARPRRQPHHHTTAQAQTPTAYNGYAHPGAYYEKRDAVGYAERAQAESEARHESLKCKCAVCLLKGPQFCPGDVEPIGARPMTTEQARAAKETLILAGQRQKMIKAQAQKAAEASYCPQRIARAVEIASDPNALAQAAVKYSSSPTECACPDARFSSTKFCKHQIAHIISANVERRIDAQVPAAEVETKPQSAPSLDSMTRVRTRTQTQAQDQVEVNDPKPAPHPHDSLMPYQPEIARTANGMILA